MVTKQSKPLIEANYLSPRWTGEIADCSLPVTLDVYSNCAFNCAYCFSQFQRGIGKGKEDYQHKKVECINLEKVKKILSAEDPNSQFYAWCKAKRPIQIGGLSDQFDWFEKKYGITYELLKFCKEINYPLSISTKGSWVFREPNYVELFKGQDNWNMKFSIITLDEKDASIIEQSVESPQKRLEAMEIYSKLNKGGSTLRLRPFIPGVSDKTYIELIKQAKEHGATAVSTEFFCLEMRSIKIAQEHYKIISKCCGFDIVEFYRRYSNGSGYLRLNRKIKAPYIEKMSELCKELGLRFYVSDAHFKECSNNCCCCGLGENWGHSRGNFSEALQIAKKNGIVRWEDIEKDMNFLNFSWERAQGFNCNSSERRAKFSGMSMKDYLKYLWNTPKAGQSPYKMFEGVLYPIEKDSSGNIVYKYNKKSTL